MGTNWGGNLPALKIKINKTEMRRIQTIGKMMVAAVMLLGCSFGEDVTKIPMNIGFKPVIGHDTRAEESVPFPADRTFNVWALNTTDGSIYLNKENIAHKAEGWLSVRKWPEAELDFTAYWPINLNPEYNKEKGLIFKDFSADDVDLLVAREKTRNESDTLVTLHFEHILSRVEFRIKHSLEENMELILTGIELNGYSQTGSYNEKGTGYWEVGAANYCKTVYDGNNGASFRITRDAQYIGNDFYTIPQICKGTATVYFNVRVNEGEWIPDSVTTKPLDTEWESGKQYTYTLNITDKQLTFTTGISNWNNRE
jgi:hypothetical protein